MVTRRVPGFHGVGMTLTVEEKASSARPGRFVGVGEVVDHLLDPDLIGGRQIAPVQGRADDAVRGGVDVDGEGGDGFLGGDLDRVDGGVGVGFGVLDRGDGGSRSGVGP